MTVLKQSLNEIYAPIEKDLALFENLLKKELESSDELISGIHTHLLKMSGKFLRPALALFCSRLGAKDAGASAARLAVVIELIHTATLVHDDIIDNSEMRRNQPSVYFKYGREISIVAGDYLYAKAFLLLAGMRDIFINEAFAACAHIMCEGEMKQIEKRNQFLMPESEYLKIIHKKTAALFQAACAGGAYMAGLSQPQIEKMADYGYQLGMAFQIVDDVLDLVGESESLGKTIGLDIYKNDVTLPILYLFQHLGGPQREALLADMRAGAPNLFSKIKFAALESGSVEKAGARAKGFIQQALLDLEGIPESPYKESLARLAAHCIERVR